MEDFLWGIANGITVWIVFIAHIFGAWHRYPFYNGNRSSNLYDFGYLFGVVPISLALAVRFRQFLSKIWLWYFLRQL